MSPCPETITLPIPQPDGPDALLTLTCDQDDDHVDLHRDPTLWGGRITPYWEDEG